MDRIPEFKPDDSPEQADSPVEATPTDRRRSSWPSLLAESRRLRVLLLSVAGSVVVLGLLAYVFTGSILLPGKYALLISKEPETKIRIPIRGISERQIADTWHAPRGRDRKHQGQDIFAPKGTPIFSATEGYVLKIGENSLGGKTVSILGAGGRVYYYAHLDSYAEKVSPGDLVSTETVIGYVGNTGNAGTTPPHLHFGVYTTSGPINPLLLF